MRYRPDSRPVGKGQRVPLAGVPYHAVDTYLARLISAGHKVAIVEQMDEQETKGLMGREVVRVVTPAPWSSLLCLKKSATTT